ncbi:MAG: hypothetical protein Q7T51_00275 [Candidatus Moranbacteria bacterium]|nr:hypothetical protein [Candidatus Moranbacteria bacterium]
MNILGKKTPVKKTAPKNMYEASLEVKCSIFEHIDQDLMFAPFDSTVKLVSQPLLIAVTNLELVTAIEKCQLAGISLGQLAWFLFISQRREEHFMTPVVVDKVQEEDGERSFVDKNGRKPLLRMVDFNWCSSYWSLRVTSIADPFKYGGCNSRVISQEPVA